MTAGNQWAMKFEAVAGKLTNAQYANLAAFFNAAIEEEREACRLIAQAEMERMRKRQIDRDGRGDMFRQGCTQGGGQMAALIEVIIRNRSKQKGVEEK